MIKHGKWNFLSQDSIWHIFIWICFFPSRGNPYSLWIHWSPKYSWCDLCRGFFFFFSSVICSTLCKDDVMSHIDPDMKEGVNLSLGWRRVAFPWWHTLVSHFNYSSGVMVLGTSCLRNKSLQRSQTTCYINIAPQMFHLIRPNQTNPMRVTQSSAGRVLGSSYTHAKTQTCICTPAHVHTNTHKHTLV